MSDSTAHRTLVTADELQRQLGRPDWRVIDVRHDLMDTAAGRRAYVEGHIPGAVFAHIDDDLSGRKTGRNGRHPLPERAAMVQAFRRWGVSDDTQIVAYDASGGPFAARLWWLARWLGHVRVALLDGGWPAWLAHGGQTSTELPAWPAGRFTDRGADVPLATTGDVAANLAAPERLLLDARTAERYRGDQEPIDPVAGHIPGARNRPWQANLAQDQKFKSPAILRKEFDAALGGADPRRVVHQCGSGVTACHSVLAMEIAGLPGSALYAGSWSEWIADASRPVATGAEAPAR
jgi:thiosulfate/3-mercaptopyruvate sulfurtransferase